MPNLRILPASLEPLAYSSDLIAHRLVHECNGVVQYRVTPALQVVVRFRSYFDVRLHAVPVEQLPGSLERCHRREARFESGRREFHDLSERAAATAGLAHEGDVGEAFQGREEHVRSTEAGSVQQNRNRTIAINWFAPPCWRYDHRVPLTELLLWELPFGLKAWHETVERFAFCVRPVHG